MTQDTVRDRIIAIIAEQAMLDPSEITLEATPAGVASRVISDGSSIACSAMMAMMRSRTVSWVMATSGQSFCIRRVTVF